jgi:acylglycerol lipase
VAQLDVARLRSGFSGPHETLSTSDGKTLFLRRWDAPTGERVTVLLFHGITGHSGAYGPDLAEPLARTGVSVFGMDLRGHGLSDGVRGDYPGPDRLVRDLSETIAFVRARSKKLVVLGHSLGALSALLSVRHCPHDIDGLILMGAGRRMRPGVYARPRTVAALRALLGIALLRGVPMIDYRREGMRGLDDPLYNFRYSARFYTTFYGVGALRLLRMLREGFLDSPNMRLEGNLRIPLLSAVGDRDELFPADSSRELGESLRSPDATYLAIPGGRHAFFAAETPGLLASWLSQRF